MTPPPRTARLVLVTPGGELLGALPPLQVSTPWWQDVKPVVDAVRHAHGVEVTVLRMLEAAPPRFPGGEVTYLAEAAGRPATIPWDGRLDEHPLRLSYARPGGPAADLAWAEAQLAAHGARPSGPAVQIRTWNLSSLWRLPTTAGGAWLKVTPPFFAHEGALLEALAGGPVPPLLGRDGSRMLMPEIAGDDRYAAPTPERLAMIDLLVALQRAWASRTDDLLRLGLPDRRGPALAVAIAGLIERNGPQLPAGDRASLDDLADGLTERLARIAECGLPDTLVHGDFHPGNFRGDGLELTLIDWGDSCVGHPLLDQPAFMDRAPADDAETIAAHWLAAWEAAVPGSDPARAARLLAPIAAARQAVIYQGFLDRIEPSEHPYHRDDPADWLGRTARLVQAEAAGGLGR